MTRIYRFLILTLILSLFIALPNLCEALTRNQALQQIRAIKFENKNKISQIEKEIHTEIQEKKEKPLYKKKVKIQNLINKRKKFLIHQNLYNQISLKLQKYYKNQSLKVFLIKQLNNMAYIEATNKDSQQNKWTLLIYLSKIIDSIPNEDKNLINFISEYLISSPLTQPLSPQNYLNKYHYSNGINSQRVKDTKPENIGDFLDTKLKHLDEIQSKKIKFAPNSISYTN